MMMIDVFGHLEIESPSCTHIQLIAIYEFANARLISIEKSNHLSIERMHEEKGRFQRMFYDVERVLNSLGQMIDLTRLPFLNALRSLVKCNYRTITDYPRKRPSGFPF